MIDSPGNPTFDSVLAEKPEKGLFVAGCSLNLAYRRLRGLDGAEFQTRADSWIFSLKAGALTLSPDSWRC